MMRAEIEALASENGGTASVLPTAPHLLVIEVPDKLSDQQLDAFRVITQKHELDNVILLENGATISALKIGPDDMILLRLPMRYMKYTEAYVKHVRVRVSAALAKMGIHQPVMVLDDDATLETVSEERLKAQGWVRAKETSQ